MMSETGIPEMHASILRSLGFSDRVISGGHQTTAMKSLLRAADETHVWLKRRYPDRDLRLTAARSGSSGRHNAHFIGESEGLSFSASRYGDVSERPYFEESLWAVLHTSEVNTWLYQRFAERGWSGVIPAVSLQSSVDDTIHPDMVVEDALTQGIHLWISGRIYLPTREPSADLRDSLRAFLSGFFNGSITLLTYDASFDLSAIPDVVRYPSIGLTGRDVITLGEVS